MNYEDLKIIWDQQADQPLFTIDHAAVLASVDDKCHTVERSANWTDLYIIPLTFFAGIPLVIEACIDSNPNWVSAAVGIIYVIHGLYTWILLKQRRKQERSYEEAVIPSINKAIFQNEHMATLLKRGLLFFHIPAGILGLIGILFYPTGMTPWTWILFVVIISYSIWHTPRYLRTQHAEERKELQAIRARLLETGQ